MQKTPGLEINVDIVMKGAKKMEKVKLTQEQVVALQRFSSDSAVIKRAVHSFDSPYHKCLEKLTLDQLCRVLYTPGSYEVIPQYKEGQVVVFQQKIDKIQWVNEEKNLICLKYAGVRGLSKQGLSRVDRFATEEERKKFSFWDSIGREVDEYKTGDVVSLDGDDEEITYLRQTEIDEGIVRFPSEDDEFSFKRIRLVVPVEQRLDK